jgi:hypothetical protein
MCSWIEEEECEFAKWRDEMNEEYQDYLIDHCSCASEDDCTCMTFDEFTDEKMKEYECHLMRMAEDYQEEEQYGIDE